MSWIVVGLVLLALNAFFGVNDVKSGKTTKSAAFTWFAVGVISSTIIDQLITLL